MVIAAVRRGGQPSRTEIAATTGLSHSTISAISSDLIAEGILTQTKTSGPVALRRGRPQVAIALNGEAATVAAVVLALDMLPIADGSDYGGSLRNPAAYNNVLGMRPSQGLVPAGPEKDLFITQIGIDGPMGRDVRDVALLLDVQAGHDARAPLSLSTHGGFLKALDTPAPAGRRPLS